MERLKKTTESLRSSPQKPPVPTATTERDDDAYSFRPYDRPKKAPKTASSASTYSESSYAPSATTAKTTPPPSVRGPYSTKDPDKIIIKAVYSFNNAFMRTPISQLISGQGNVTDGLILRITTEGLFIDDDVRGVPQREWDVKAWTMKLAEVWCPSLPTDFPKKSSPFIVKADSRRTPILATHEEDCPSLTKWKINCDWYCRPRRTRSSLRNTSFASTSETPPSHASYAASSISSYTDSTTKQSCEVIGLHVLRASIRDQEGKKYVFILSQGEGWKVAVGLQRLRRGTQVRALGVAGMPQNEAKALIENLGWA